ncbi:hypothetical protein KKE26_09870 [bacterium]|nr:hypothetical protein [bacterium]
MNILLLDVQVFSRHMVAEPVEVWLTIVSRDKEATTRVAATMSDMQQVTTL